MTSKWQKRLGGPTLSLFALGLFLGVACGKSETPAESGSDGASESSDEESSSSDEEDESSSPSEDEESSEDDDTSENEDEGDDTESSEDDDTSNEDDDDKGDDEDESTTDSQNASSDEDDEETNSSSDDDDTTTDSEPFSFFVTSLEAMRELSGSEDGFGGDLGGIEGADEICQTIADGVGAGHKTWRAFLSATTGGDGGGPVHAIDRIGDGPWYDANGRLVAMDKAGLLKERPAGDAAVADDLPDEFGRPLMQFGDNHDVMTGTNQMGQLEENDPVSTCNDWTSAVGEGTENRVRCGHSWPARSGMSWMTAHKLRGCAPGVNLVQDGPGTGNCVGCSGGYGGIYCFALTP